MLKQILLVWWVVIWVPLFAHEEYCKLCQKQDKLRKEIKRHKSSKESLWERLKNEPMVSFKSLDKKIEDCKKEIAQLESTKHKIENEHDVRIKRIKLSNIPDVDSFKRGHADITVFRNKNVILGPVHSDDSIEFNCDLLIKRGDVFEIKDKDKYPSGYDPIGVIVFSRIIQEILSREETQGIYRGQFQPPYNYCKFELYFHVKKRR